jgi:hypothetical protein
MSNTTDPGRAPGSTHTGMRAFSAPHVPWSTDVAAWMDDAECRKYVHRRSTGVGVDWFSLHPSTAAKICEECPVVAACAERVLKLRTDPETHPKAGVWAGKLFEKESKRDAA